MYKWVKGNSFTKIATIYSGNITLNVPCINFFNGAKWCAIGIDNDNKKIGIKILSKEDIDKKVFPEDSINKVSIGKSFVRISNKAIIREINKTKTLHSKAKFGVNFDVKDKILEIDLNSPM